MQIIRQRRDIIFKRTVILFAALFWMLSGCVSTDKSVEKRAAAAKKAPVVQQGPATIVAVGMDKAAVVEILSRPDFVSSLEGQTIFFYCTDSTHDAAGVRCIPILFEDGKVSAVGEDDAQKWRLDTVRFKVEADREKERARKPQNVEYSDGIAVETLAAGSSFIPKRGDRVYIDYYTNLVRYVPLRSEPSPNGGILNTLCIGAELTVLSVQDDWLNVRGEDENCRGWVRRHWVTNDRTVKIDAEKRRHARAPEIARLEAMVKPIPRSKWKENLDLYEKLSALDPCNRYYQRKVDFYRNYGGQMQKRKRK